MSITDDFKAALVADAGAGGVKTLLTGGIYTYADTGRLGIGEHSTPAAFDGTTHKLKPCAVIKARPQVPDGGIADDDLQEVSFRQVVEVWLYNDGNAGYSTLEAVQARLLTVLHGKTIGGRLVRWQYSMAQEREDMLTEACMTRTDFETFGVT